jgi:hypothetical protein
MKVTIELCGQKEKINDNIEALNRVIEGKPLCSDFILLIDTKSILEAIKEELL